MRFLPAMRKDDSTPVKKIDPDTVRTPSAAGTRSKDARSTALPTVLFFVLVSVAALVFLALPEWVDRKTTDEPLSEEPPVHLLEPPEPLSEPSGVPEALAKNQAGVSDPESTALKLHAEKLLLDLLEKQEALQQQGVELWARDGYDQAMASGNDGDAYFREQAFSEAADYYEQTIDLLEALQKQAASVLDEALGQGQQALSRNQGEVAAQHFNLALAVDSRNRQALDGLSRAATLSELFALLDRGGNLEAANHLQGAEQVYREAVALDPLSGEAAAALHRITVRLNQDEFSRWMTRAYDLLKDRQFDDARTAFHKAQTLLPDSDSPAQGLLRIDQIELEEKIARLEVEALHFEEREDWEHAARSWQQLLALAPQTPHAREAAERSSSRAALLAMLEGYLEHSERLYSAEVSAEVQALLDEIGSLEESPGRRILQSASALQDVIEQARQPVSIALYSDNQTDVSIFRVGQLGRFEHQDVQLRPGRYTILGSRPGYRDVRKTLNVTPDMKNGRVRISCEETI